MMALNTKERRATHWHDTGGLGISRGSAASRCSFNQEDNMAVDDASPILVELERKCCEPMCPVCLGAGGQFAAHNCTCLWAQLQRAVWALEKHRDEADARIAELEAENEKLHTD